MKKISPLVHLISNEVTLNDVVNVVLGAGGRAICATAKEEVLEITSISDVLVLNTGIPSKNKLETMLIAGKRANEIGIPVVLDPVGLGVSAFRNEFINHLLEEISFTCIKGNKTEIAELCGFDIMSEGVDSRGVKLSTSDIQHLALRTGAIIVATGEVNIIADDRSSFEVKGGSPLLTKITGSGCMLAGLIGLYLAGEGQNINSVVSAVKYFNRAGKSAELDLVAGGIKGTGSYRISLIDRLSERGEYL